MRFAVIGCGYISRVHLSALRRIDGACAVAAVNRNREKAQERAAEFGIPRVYTDWNEAFACDDVDAALICLPHKLHYPCALDALNAGKHVLIEKPISITSAQAAEMIALADEKGLTLMVAHMKRFDRRFRVMKDRIEAGAISRVFLAKSEWIGPKEVFTALPWAGAADQGGGPLMGFGSHHVDLLQWMLGPISRVHCCTNNLVWPDISVEDTAVAALQFECGAVGALIYTWGAEICGQSETLTIHGTRGTLDLRGEEVYFTCEAEYGDRTPRRLDTERPDRRDIEEFGKELAISSLEPFELELRHFIGCVRTGARPSIDGVEAKKAVDIIVKAYRSAARRRARSSAP